VIFEVVAGKVVVVVVVGATTVLLPEIGGQVKVFVCFGDKPLSNVRSYTALCGRCDSQSQRNPDHCHSRHWSALRAP